MVDAAQAQFVTRALIRVAQNDDRSNGAVVAFRRVPLMSGRAGESGTVRQQIGETLAKVDLLLQAVRDNREESKVESERLWMELRTIKHDENNRQQILSARLEMADRRSGEIERRIGVLEEANTELKKLLAAIEGPVKQIVEFRGRLGWISSVIIAGGLLVWTVGKPIYDGWIGGWFKR